MSTCGSGKAPSPGVKKPPILSTSWSFTDNEPDTKYDHSNFTRQMDMENGEELMSGVFSIRTKDRQKDWFMRINPNGEEKTCKGFVYLFLYKDGVCEVPINADIIFSIVDKEGVKTRAKRCEYTFEKNLPSDNRGYAKFVSHSELRHPQLNLSLGDTLTILYCARYQSLEIMWSPVAPASHSKAELVELQSLCPDCLQTSVPYSRLGSLLTELWLVRGGSLDVTRIFLLAGLPHQDGLQSLMNRSWTTRGMDGCISGKY